MLMESCILDMMTGSGSALLIIDVQKDFCDGGALPVPDGDRVVPPLNRYIRDAVGTRMARVRVSRLASPGHEAFQGSTEESGRRTACRAPKALLSTRIWSCRRP